MKDRLDALESQCAGSDSSGCLHGALEKAWLAAADGDILSLLILRLAVLLCRWSILRNWLIRRRRRLLLLLWHGIVLTQEAAQKARGMRRLSGAAVLHLLLQLRELRLGLVEGDVLHQHRLRQHVDRIGIRAELLVEQRVGVGIFFSKLCLVDPLDERIKELFFLGSQRCNLRRPATAGSGRLSLLRRDTAGKVAPPIVSTQGSFSWFPVGALSEPIAAFAESATVFADAAIFRHVHDLNQFRSGDFKAPPRRHIFRIAGNPQRIDTQAASERQQQNK